MDDDRLPKKKLNYKPEGRSNIGRSQTRWEDDFRGGRNRTTGLSLIDDDDDDLLLTVSKKPYHSNLFSETQ